MKRWFTYLLVGALLVGGLMVSVFYSPVWYDDAGHFWVAREVARGHGMCYPLDSEGTRCIPDSPFITMGPVQAYPLGGWMAIFGQSMLVARLAMVLLTLAATYAFYRLGTRLTRPQKALVAVGILALNIQFLTYGAEVLGEVPMMGLVLAGMGCFLRWDKSGNWWWAAGGILAWCLAVGIKEYALLPMGVGMASWWLMREVAKDRPVAVLKLGIGLLLALALTLMLLHGGPGSAVQHYLDRQMYGSEFLAFNLGLSLKFLALKPLFWLGTGAMVLKWRVKRRPEEALTLSVQAGWLLFYLMSAGYDRFGFLLLFLPAIYVAEFVPYFWKSLGRITHWAWLRRTALVLLGVALFGQQTWWVFGRRVTHFETVNSKEKAVTARLKAANAKVVVTAEQQLGLFLDDIGQEWRLVSVVPSQARSFKWPLPEFLPEKGEVFVAGPYAFTEYQTCIDWQELAVLDSIGLGADKWVIYRRK